MAYIRDNQWASYSREELPTGSKMHGTIVVKDISGNVHRQEYDDVQYIYEGDDAAKHVERKLVDSIIADFRRTGRRLQTGKVTVAMYSSPCQRCTSNIIDWYDKLSDAILGQNGTLFLLFAFRQFYTIGKHGWPSVGAASDAYQHIVDISERGVKTTKSPLFDHKILSTISFVHEPINSNRSYPIGFRLHE